MNAALTWPLRMAGFLLWYAKAFTVSNLTVLRDNLTPGQDSAPGIARVPTACRSDAEITLLATLITLTPGTLTVGTETAAEAAAGETTPTRVLYVHSMYSADADAVRREIHDMEARMLHAIRRTGHTT